MEDQNYIKSSIDPILKSLTMQLLVEKPQYIDWLQNRIKNGPDTSKDDLNKNIQKGSSENQSYISTQIHPIYEKLIIDLLINKPQEPAQYMLDWIKNNGTMFMSKEEIQNYQNMDKNNKQNIIKSKNKEQVSSDEENEQDDEEDYIDEVPLEILQNKGKQGMRTSVSAEVYGKFNQQKEFLPRNIHKNSEQRERINKRIQSCFMFMGLTDSDKEIIVMAMEEKKFNPGDWIIKQGEDGSELYVVDSGELDCFKKFSKNEEPKYLKTYNIGESFGELALLYNSPRQASIRAKTDSVLWALDRDTFNNIIKQATISKRKKYQNFMLQVDLLKELSEYEREQVCDSLRVMNFKKGEFVVKQGEQGDMFYMVEDGDLVALKIMQPGGDYQEVMSYTTGMYFGELALLKNQPRAASILCKTDCQLVGLDRYSFKRLLGNLEDILKRNSEQYSKYVN